MMTKKFIENVISGMSDENQIIEKLESEGICFDKDRYSREMNIRIPIKNGCIRIYDTGKRIVVKKVEWLECECISI